MYRFFLLCSLVAIAACSTSQKVEGIDTDAFNTGTGTTTDTTSTFTGNTTTTTTNTGDTDDACATAPTGGPIAALGDCEYVPNPSGMAFSSQIEWSMTQPMVDPATGIATTAYVFADHADFASVYHAPNLAQMNDDNNDGIVDDEDIPDIAVIMAHADESAEAVLRLISGDGSAVHATSLWSWNTNNNGTDEYAPYHYAGLATGDIDGDGNLEIATLVTRRSDGLCWPAMYQVTTGPVGIDLTLEAVYGGSNYNCGGHSPAIADLDNDGSLEMIYGRAVFNPDFTQKWYGTGGRGWYGRVDYPYPEGYWNSGYHAFAYDMDGDGAELEVVAGRTVYEADGAVFCELGTYVANVWQPAIDGYPSVADLGRFPGDIQGEPEIVVTGNEWVSVYHGVPDYDPNGLNRCTLVAEIPNAPTDDPDVWNSMPVHPNCDLASKSFGGPSTIADFDGDGDNEIAVAGACWYSVYHFDETNGHRFERFAMAQTKDWSSASTGSTVFDFNGDGAAEVVFSDEEAIYVWGIDATAGLDPWDRLVPYLIDTEHKSWTIHEYPLVADLDNDGKAEILVTNSHLPGFEGHYGLYALGASDDDWVSARKVWNQHAYFITNVEDDGDIGYCDPNYAPYTTEDYNSFRLQAPGSFGALAASNLFAEGQTCQNGCSPDAIVWVQVGNEGLYISASPDVVVSLYGVDAAGARTLLAEQTLGSLLGPATLSDPVEFQVAGWAQWDHLVAVADDPLLGGPVGGDGAAKECEEGDNEIVIDLSGLCL